MLIVGKNGTKNLNRVEAADPPEKPSVDLPDPRADFGGQLVVKNLSLSHFADFLGNHPPYGVDEKVLDQTGIDGLYDLTLRWPPELGQIVKTQFAVR